MCVCVCARAHAHAASRAIPDDGTDAQQEEETQKADKGAGHCQRQRPAGDTRYTESHVVSLGGVLCAEGKIISTVACIEILRVGGGGWLLNIPATCLCSSGTDLPRQLYSFSSAQDGIVASRKAHMRSTLFLSSPLKVAFERVPIFASLNTDRF